MHPRHPTRRRLLLGSGAAVAAAFTGPVAALAGRTAAAAGDGCQAAEASARVDSPYGPLAPVNDLSTGLPLVQLPAGFSCRSHGWAGDTMGDGLPTPAAHDGMGVVRSRRVGDSQEIVLVRNHELAVSRDPARIVGAGRAGVAHHDVGHIDGAYPIGGTTNLVWRDGRWVDSFASFGGLLRPCAGGATAWGSWLSNEEVRSNAVSSTGRRHGHVFEVPADTSETAANPLPIIGMGRMAHEASALDLRSGDWYLTEDQADANTLYRFRPAKADGGRGSLHAGGRLQGLAVRGRPHADLRFPTLCQEFHCHWVDIAEPDRDGGLLVSAAGLVAASGPYRQAHAKGAALFGATEGCWVADGTVYFTDKATGSLPQPRAGVVWALHLDSMLLRAIFVSRDRVVGNSPDNLCISPRGGLLFCEDGDNGLPRSAPVAAQQLKVLTPQGASYAFASHNADLGAAQLAYAGKSPALAGDHRHTEWAGAVFSADGEVLFVNLYSPGITLAITGPWERGDL